MQGVLSFRNIAIALLILWFLALAQNAWYWQNLPERVATHFNAAGKPDGWMGRDAATMMMIGLQTLMPLLFVAIAYMLYFIPPAMINIPHREFWLHPDRRQASISFVARSTAAFSLGLSLFLLGMNHLTFLANTRHGVLNPLGFWALLGTFLAFSGAWTAWLVMRFRIPK